MINQHVVLLRGVNVGGNNLLPMKELKFHLEGAGYTKVQTYIQSGNIVVQGTDVSPDRIASIINQKFGFTPGILAMPEDVFRAAVANNPYSSFEGKFVHFYFCKTNPSLDTTRVTKLKSATEQYHLNGTVLYLHAPDGIGRSKLAAQLESCLGVAATSRNLNTIRKLENMLTNA